MDWKETHELEFRLHRIDESESITLLPILETKIENGHWLAREANQHPCGIGEGSTLAQAVLDWLAKRIT